MTTTSGSFQVHTAARGPHWIAWLTQGGDSKPYRSVLLIAATAEEAQTRGQQWAERQASGA
jgi:hypothetical protein